MNDDDEVEINPYSWEGQIDKQWMNQYTVKEGQHN